MAVAGEVDAGGEVRGAVGDEQHGGGVEQDDVAAGAGFAGEDRAQDGGVGWRRRLRAGRRAGRG